MRVEGTSFGRDPAHSPAHSAPPRTVLAFPLCRALRVEVYPVGLRIAPCTRPFASCCDVQVTGAKRPRDRLLTQPPARTQAGMISSTRGLRTNSSPLEHRNRLQPSPPSHEVLLILENLHNVPVRSRRLFDQLPSQPLRNHHAPHRMR